MISPPPYNRVYRPWPQRAHCKRSRFPLSWQWGNRTVSSALPLIISVTLGVILAIFSSITAPLILAHRTEKMHREDREAEYARQDEMARAAHAAVQAAGRAATDARTFASETATKVTAQLDAAEATAARATESTNSRLDIIHALVNSGLTSVMKEELAALERELGLLHEVCELHRANGREPTPEMLATIKVTEQKVAELTQVIADREAAEQASKDKHGSYPQPDDPPAPQDPESSAP
jgi:hypothetical protein